MDPSFLLTDDDEIVEQDTTLYLPGQGDGQEQGTGLDFTGLPQGSDSNTILGGRLLLSPADDTAMGNGTVTAQSGGLPG